MVTKTSMNIQAVDQSGNKVQKTLTDINPDASPAKLKEFAEALNGLTNNVYGSANRIEVKSLGGGNLQNPELYWPTGTGGEKQKTTTVTLTQIMQDTTHDTQGGEPDTCGSHAVEIGYALDSKQIPYIKSNGTMIPVAIGANVSPDEPYHPTWVLYLSAGWNFDYKLEGDTFVPPLYGDIVIAIDADDTYDGDEITLTITEG